MFSLASAQTEGKCREQDSSQSHLSPHTHSGSQASQANLVSPLVHQIPPLTFQMSASPQVSRKQNGVQCPETWPLGQARELPHLAPVNPHL